MSVEELGNLLGSKIREQDSGRATQGIEGGTLSTYFIFGNYRFRVNISQILIETRNIGGDALIWGNAIFGIWNSFKWASTANLSFILGNPLAGVLGISKLGSQFSSFATFEDLILTQTIPTIAREEIAKWLVGVSAENPSHMSLGTGTTGYNEDDTSLETEIIRKTITYNLGTSKTAKYIMNILTTDTSFHAGSFSDSFDDTVFRDTDNTNAAWTGDGEIVFT